MNTTQRIEMGTITVKGRERMAFRRSGQVFYFPSINRKPLPASTEDAATWEGIQSVLAGQQ